VIKDESDCELFGGLGHVKIELPQSSWKKCNHEDKAKSCDDSGYGGQKAGFMPGPLRLFEQTFVDEKLPFEKLAKNRAEGSCDDAGVQKVAMVQVLSTFKRSITTFLFHLRDPDPILQPLRIFTLPFKEKHKCKADRSH
jgi:hypothetical protein